MFPRFLLASLLLSLVGVNCIAANNPDHLEPPFVYENNHPIEQYKATVNKKLLITKGDYGQLLVIPSTIYGEWALSIHPSRSDTFSVTYTKAAHQIWPLKTLAAASHISVRRSNAELPASTATAVRAAWLAMIERTAPYPPTENVIVDGTSYEFSIKQNATLLFGVAHSPTSGRKTKALVHIAQQLREYCLAAAQDRPSLAGKIETAATRLRGSLLPPSTGAAPPPTETPSPAR